MPPSSSYPTPHTTYLPVHQTQPIKVNPNTESSPSNFIFYFTLDNTLPSDGYLLVTSCVNLNSAGD